jgi:hypothetical protein
MTPDDHGTVRVVPVWCSSSPLADVVVTNVSIVVISRLPPIFHCTNTAALSSIDDEVNNDMAVVVCILRTTHGVVVVVRYY